MFFSNKKMLLNDVCFARFTKSKTCRDDALITFLDNAFDDGPREGLTSNSLLKHQLRTLRWHKVTTISVLSP